MRGRGGDLLVQVSDHIHALQRVLDHASLALMMKYTHFSPGYLAGVSFKLPGNVDTSVGRC
ncbi:hypothetical protein DYL61_17855 [Pseudomonas nabeulensis]|uniref:Integrase n=1 Tax=Pseudomonas nabeulensis TaxID=2293833 RepID=A0A4Z0AYW1_9PSED|nr:hypothetical protein DYL61_17855 [Pseudomonas nabeulensis]